MQFNFSFYSSLLLLFFSQGIVFSFVLWKKGIISESLPNKWLSFFVFLCSIYLLPWMLGFAGWYSLQPYRDIMFYIPFQQVLLIGPAIFFYTQSLLNSSFQFKKRDWLHFVPAFTYLTYRLILFVTDKIILNYYYFYEDQRDKNLDSWYQIVGFISMLIYFLLSLKYYFTYKKIIYQTLSFADTMLFSWIKKYLIAFLLMQVLWLTFYFLFPDWGNFKEKWWYYLLFSSLMYYIAITGYANNLASLTAFKVSGIDTKDIYGLASNFDEPTNNPTVDSEAVVQPIKSSFIEEWKLKISGIIEKERLYQNSNLTLLDVAQKLSTNPTLISKMINQGFQINFNDYINEYRVQSVIQSFKRGEHKKQTLLAIAIDNGFNSKTTFNRCFKKSVGLSPKEFLKNLEE